MAVNSLIVKGQTNQRHKSASHRFPGALSLQIHLVLLGGFLVIGVTPRLLLHPHQIPALAERVGIDGTINVEPIGRIWIAGMTLEEAEVHLTEKAAAYFTQSDVQVSLKTGAKSYFIFGEVGGSGGRKPLNRDLTLFEAVMDAKPSQNSANLGRVRLIRADPVEPLVITANLGQILTVGDTTFNPVILEDDIIVVPPTMLAQVGYFVSDLVYPFTTVFQTVFQGLFKLNSLGNKLNNNNQNNLF